MQYEKNLPELQLPDVLSGMRILFQELLPQFLSEHLPEYKIQTQFEIEGMLAMYALSEDSCNRASILYPTTQPEAQEAKIEVRVPKYPAEHAYVILRPVDLLKLEKLIIDIKTRNNERGQKDFARWLAFGDD